MPLCEIDCGLKCGPYNDYGVPICCDINQVVPAAFELEWEYLKDQTDFWSPWKSSNPHFYDLEEEVQNGQVLIQCQGYQECQRDYRTLTCRAFPFFPYLDSKDTLSGMAYFPEFRSGCWIISNLDVVSQPYKEAFQGTFQELFAIYPDYLKDHADFCRYIREQAAEEHKKIVMLGFYGGAFLVDPLTEEKIQVEYKELSAFGPFEITRELRFPGE
jgi:hypothetical protein